MARITDEQRRERQRRWRIGYYARNADRIKAAQNQYYANNRDGINAKRRGEVKPEKRTSQEGAAVVVLLERLIDKSGMTRRDFVAGMSRVGDKRIWSELREVYQRWRDTDEGQSLIGNR